MGEAKGGLGLGSYHHGGLAGIPFHSTRAHQSSWVCVEDLSEEGWADVHRLLKGGFHWEQSTLAILEIGYFASKQYLYTSVYGACMPTLFDVVRIGLCRILCTMVAEQYGPCAASVI